MVYSTLDTPKRSTMYVAWPGDSAGDKVAVGNFTIEEYLKDWLPRVGYRGVDRPVPSSSDSFDVCILVDARQVSELRGDACRHGKIHVPC